VKLLGKSMPVHPKTMWRYVNFVRIITLVLTFIDVLLKNSKLIQAKIYTAASKAADNPAIGVTINNPAAAHVIKDCATITMKCLPLYVFAEYKDPFKELCGKFAKQDIAEFVKQTETDSVLNLLLTAILARAQKEMPNILKPTKVAEAPLNVLGDGIDPYGGYYSEQVVVETKERSIEEILQEAFKC
jgi:hypothetical protein